MKLIITNIIRKNFVKILSYAPSIKLERKVDTYKKIVDRNKLIAPSTNSVDEVINCAKTKKINYRVYF